MMGNRSSDYLLNESKHILLDSEYVINSVRPLLVKKVSFDLVSLVNVPVRKLSFYSIRTLPPTSKLSVFPIKSSV